MKLEWNTGGWFGSQLGGTMWILLSAVISLGHHFSTGMILLMLFLVPNIIGLILWRQRKLTCYQSLQIVFALCGIFGLAAIFVLDRNSLWLEIQKGGTVSKEAGYLLITIAVLAIMAWFHLKYGRKPNDRST